MNMEPAPYFESQDLNISPSFDDYCNKYSCSSNQPYAGSLLDPQVRMDYRTKWTGKPPFSYATLICLAMRELGKPKVTLSDIYGWIMNNFAYYRHTDSSWQNSVRHNLSLNKCFEKVPRDKGERGKGGFWRVNPRHIDWLEANLAKCRRAAPPPGPPPPIPRSMLLQQRKMQQQSQYQQALLPRSLMLSPSSVSVGNSVTTSSSFTATICVPELSSESIKNHQVSALSPSSNSSLSSSPLSFASVGSPANFQSTRIPVAPAHTYPNAVHTVLVNHCTLSDMKNSSTLPPLSLSGNVSQSCVTQTVASHRRKSPLFKNHSQGGATNNVLFESDDSLSEDDTSSAWTESIHSTNKSPNIYSKLNNYDSNQIMPNFHSDWSKKSRSVNSNVNSVNYKNSQNQSLSRSNGDNLDQLPCKNRSKSNFDKSRVINRSTAFERLKRSKSKQNIKQSGLNESKLVPTRVLPPRQRYSRWALPRPNPIISDNLVNGSHQTSHGNKLESLSYRKNKRYDDHKLTQWDSNDLLGKCGLSPLLGYIDSDDENKNGNNMDSSYIWPPLTKAENHITYGSSHHAHTTMKKVDSTVTTSSSCGLCEDYCLPNCNPHQMTSNITAFQSESAFKINNNNNDRGAFNVSACSSSSSASTFSYHSDLSNVFPNSKSIDQFHSSCGTPSYQHSENSDNNGMKVLKSTAKNGFVQNDYMQNNSLLPSTLPGDSNSVNKSSSADESTLANWASVFLSDDDASDLDCLFNDNKQTDDAFNLFTNESFESGVHSTSTLQSSPTSLSSPPVPPTSSSCLLKTPSFLSKSAKDIPEIFVSDSKQPIESSNVHSSNDNNPILEELGLETVGLDFESLDVLVDSGGTIPLDIDFSLTTGFNSDTFLDSGDSLAHDWNTSSTCHQKNINNNKNVGNLLSDKIQQENQPQWPENLEMENDVISLQQNSSSDSQWSNGSHVFNSSNGLTMFLTEASVQMFEGNFNESQIRLCRE
ncbi:unnamed protein product [Heterobilharzia americana]|nr:unnamed protein product [Heterobilharzia americana]